MRYLKIEGEKWDEKLRYRTNGDISPHLRIQGWQVF